MIPGSLPGDQKHRMKLLLIQCFFIVFRKMMTASYSGVMVDSVLLFPCIAMLVSDHLEDGSLLCLKAHVSYMDCSICYLLSRLPNKLRTSKYTLQHTKDFNDDDGHRRALLMKSRRNTSGQLSLALNIKRNLSATVKNQLDIARKTLIGSCTNKCLHLFAENFCRTVQMNYHQL